MSITARERIEREAVARGWEIRDLGVAHRSGRSLITRYFHDSYYVTVAYSVGERVSSASYTVDRQHRFLTGRGKAEQVIAVLTLSNGTSLDTVKAELAWLSR